MLPSHHLVFAWLHPGFVMHSSKAICAGLCHKTTNFGFVHFPNLHSPSLALRNPKLKASGLPKFLFICLFKVLELLLQVLPRRLLGAENNLLAQPCRMAWGCVASSILELLGQALVLFGKFMIVGLVP